MPSYTFVGNHHHKTHPDEDIITGDHENIIINKTSSQDWTSGTPDLNILKSHVRLRKRQEKRRKAKMLKLRIIKIFIMMMSVIFMMVNTLMVFNGIQEVNREEKLEEKESNLYLNPEDFLFNRSTIIGISFLSFLMIILVISGVTFNHFCLLLFTGSSGTAVFLIHIMILVLESVIKLNTGLIFAAFVTIYSGAILFLSYRINIYKEYHSPSHANHILMSRSHNHDIMPQHRHNSYECSDCLNSMHEFLDYNPFLSDDRNQLTSHEVIRSVDIGLVNMK